MVRCGLLEAPMTKTICLLTSVALNIWFAVIIINLENYHYASMVGFCSEFSGADMLVKKEECLNQTESRTHSLWHLYYAVIR